MCIDTRRPTTMAERLRDLQDLRAQCECAIGLIQAGQMRQITPGESVENDIGDFLFCLGRFAVADRDQAMGGHFQPPS